MQPPRRAQDTARSVVLSADGFAAAAGAQRRPSQLAARALLVPVLFRNQPTAVQSAADRQAIPVSTARAAGCPGGPATRRGDQARPFHSSARPAVPTGVLAEPTARQ